MSSLRPRSALRPATPQLNGLWPDLIGTFHLLPHLLNSSTSLKSVNHVNLSNIYISLSL